MAQATRRTTRKPQAALGAPAKSLERDAGKTRVEAGSGKIAGSKVPGRMPERSEAVSGVEAEGLTPVTAARKPKPQKVVKAKTFPKRVRG